MRSASGFLPRNALTPPLSHCPIVAIKPSHLSSVSAPTVYLLKFPLNIVPIGVILAYLSNLTFALLNPTYDMTNPCVSPELKRLSAQIKTVSTGKLISQPQRHMPLCP